MATTDKSLDVLINEYCSKNPNESICELISRSDEILERVDGTGYDLPTGPTGVTCGNPLYCINQYINDATSVTGEFICNPHPENVDKAKTKFKDTLDLPDIPDDIVNDSTNTLFYIHIYQIILIAGILLLIILILGMAGWISVTSAIFLVVGAVMLLFIFSMLYVSTLYRLKQDTQTNLQNYHDSLEDSLSRIPLATINGLCAYEGCTAGACSANPDCTCN